ncbi:MAG: hypothetical protein JWQ21_132, partial [Herminiimonas sp.]|nr:hypothetical protein [Herminiimonas sp.]
MYIVAGCLLPRNRICFNRQAASLDVTHHAFSLTLPPCRTRNRPSSALIDATHQSSLP